MAEEKKDQGKKNMDPHDMEIPPELPVLPLQGFVFFPGMGFPLQVKNESAKKLIDDILLGDRLLALVTHRPMEEKPPEIKAEHLYSMGVMGYIHKLVKNEDHSYQILTTGIRTVKIEEYNQTRPYFKAAVSGVVRSRESGKDIEAHILSLRTQFKKLAELTRMPQEISMTLDSLSDPFYVSYFVASMLNLSVEKEQGLLETLDLRELVKKVGGSLNESLETAEMSEQIQKSAKEDMSKKQREFYLRQQLEAIRKELGEDEGNPEIAELRKKLAETDLTEEAERTAEKELKRLERIQPSSPEYTVCRNYLDWILELPWKNSTKDMLDLKKAQEDLDRDHYGLERIK
ncbi:MAG: LON peptidase substrate-binding domain-containing protein, partial [Desulfobia sp.]